MKIKKSFIYYAIAWLVLLCMFVAITFVIPKTFLGKMEEVPVMENGVVVGTEMVRGSKYQSPIFWVSFAFVLISFFGQLACAFLASVGDEKKTFLRMPLLYTSATALAVMAIIGSICMAFYRVLGIVAIIVCIIALGVSVISVLRAKAAGDAVDAIDEKIKVKTSYIKMLTVDAQVAVSKAQGEEMKQLARKIYEAVRYSDPVSCDELASVEEKMTAKFSEFDNAVSENNYENAKSASDALLILITERNAKCKALK